MIDQTALDQAVQRIVAVADPSQIILFGSYARGEADADSDLDLLVIQPQVENPVEMMLTVRRALGAMGLGVDVLVYSEAEFARRSRVPGTVHYWAQREGKMLYEATL
jgi:uncharacterized protein